MILEDFLSEGARVHHTETLGLSVNAVGFVC